ncbi:amino acid adenylation domain-containing protein [Aquimarina rhabdastrellae]
MNNIAITGISLECSGASSLEEFKKGLEIGKMNIGQPTAERIKHSYISEKEEFYPYGYLNRVDEFDHTFFKLSKAEADAIDPGHRRLLEKVCEAIENGGYNLDEVSKKKTGLFITVNKETYNYLYQSPNPQLDFVGGISSMASGRIAHLLNITGPVMNIETACSSSLVAVHEAVQKLKNKEIEYAIVGGARLLYDFPDINRFDNDAVMSPDGICRAFDENAQGTSGGEGIAVIVLKREEDAINANDNIYALIKGSAINHDGSSSNGLTAPSPSAQKEVLLEACSNAEIPISSVGYIETHGTGTKLGDPIEYKAIKEAFESNSDAFDLKLGTLKPNIGHLDNMSGIFGLIKAVLVLREKKYFPTINYKKLNSFIQKDKRIRIENEEENWVLNTDNPRRAGISSFGLSGTNAHVILEEYAKEEKYFINENEWFKISAKNKESLSSYTNELIRFFDTKKDKPLKDIAYTYNVGRKDYEYELIIEGDETSIVSDLYKKNKSIDALTPRKKSSKIACFFTSEIISEEQLERTKAKFQAFKKHYDNIRIDNLSKKTNTTNIYQYAIYSFLEKKGLEFSHLICNGDVARNTKYLIEGKYDQISLSNTIEKTSINWDKLKLIISKLKEDNSTFLYIGNNPDISNKLQLMCVEYDLPYIDFINKMLLSNRNIWANLYDTGIRFDWDLFYKDENVEKVITPTYPFQKTACWNPIKNPLLFDNIENNNEEEKIEKGSTIDDVVINLLKTTIQNDSFSLEDDFFELGGNSIVGTQFINRINELFNISLEFDELYDCYSINEIISLVKERYNDIGDIEVEEVKIESEEKVVLPLTNTQYRIWVDSQNIEESIAYNINFNIKIEGNIQPKILEEAFNKLIDRHESLRLRFLIDEEGNAYQKIIPSGQVPLTLEVSEIAASNTDQIYKSIFNNYQIPFNLEKGSLLRAKLIKLANDKNILVLSFHHIIFDGWSSGTFLNELMETYMKLLRGISINVEIPSNQQYSNYVKWFVNEINKDSMLKHKEYWKEKLVGTYEKIDIGKKSGSIAFQGAQNEYKISEVIKSKLLKIAKEQRTTLFVVLLASVRTYLYKISKQNVIIGTPVSGRMKQEFEKTLGLFINTLPLKTTIDKSHSVLSCINKEKETVTEALQHQLYPYDSIINDLDLKNDKGNSLYDIMVILQNQNNRFGLDEIINEDLPIKIEEGIEIKETKVKTELAFTFFENEKDLDLNVEYNTSVYNPKLMETIINNYIYFLNDFTEEIHREITEVASICKAEEEKILRKFNDTKLNYNRKESFVFKIRNNAKTTPTNIAIFDNDKKITYREVEERSNALANYLVTNYGIKQGDLIGVKLERNYWLPIVLLAVIKTGAAYVPIDPKYPKDRITYIEKDSSCKLTIDNNKINTFLTQEDKYLNDFKIPEIDEQQLAYIIYTSGSTGNPKGVMITHENATSFIMWCKKEFNLEKFELVYAVTSHCFDLSIFEIFFTLSTGKPLRILQSGLEIDKFIEKDKNILLNTVPSVINTIIDKKINLKNVVMINMAGEPLPIHLIKALPYERIEIRNLYGPSEDTTYSTCHLVKTDKGTSVPIGRPIGNTKAYVLDEEMNLCPIGIKGELYLAGSGLSKGYLGKETLTDEKFIANPFMKEERIYSTGDIVHWLPNGELEYVGRKDAQVKIRGYRIELGEIENCILEEKEFIKDAVVDVKEWQGQKELVAYLVLKDKNDDDKVKKYLKSKLITFLPEYMLPKYFVYLDKIPLTPNGKVNRKALPEIDEDNLMKREYIAAQNDTQAQIISLWKEFLVVEKIGILDSFFDLGGNSLVATKVIAKLNLLFNTDYPLDFLFHVETIKDIAKYIDNGYTFNEDYYILGNPEASQIIFAFPPGLGYGTAYKELFDNQKDVKVIAFNYLENQENKIMHYADIIEELQPEGELIFFGWSAGGNLSYELEKVMYELFGRRVSNTIMLDSYANNEHWTEEDFDHLDDFVKYDLGLKELLDQSANVLYRVKDRMFDYCKTVHNIDYDYKSNARLYFIKATVELAPYEWESLYDEIEYYDGIGEHYDMLKEEFLEDNKEIVLNIVKEILHNVSVVV